MYCLKNSTSRPVWRLTAIICLSFCLTLSNKSRANQVPYHGFRFVDGKKSTVLSFELINNLIVIPVMINKQTVISAALDTGLRSFVLYGEKFTPLLDFSNGREVSFSGLGNDLCPKGMLSINNRLKIGDVLGDGIGIVHIAEPSPFGAWAPQIDAIFGYQLFSRFVVSINYQDMKITLTEKSHYHPQAKSFTLPLTLIDTKPSIEGQVLLPDHTLLKANLMVDTGASAGIILYAQSSDKINLPKKRNRVIIGKGISGTIRGYVGVAPTLKLGGYEQPKVALAIIHQHNCDGDFPENEINGLIGVKILS